jgi:adenylylsulfate kinase
MFLNTTGFTIWFTGLSGSGKTTLANLVGQELLGRGMTPEILDGDMMRTHLCKGLGYSKEDRDTNIRRIGWVCQLLTRHGLPNIAAAVSPYREVRNEVRQLVETAGGVGSFIEVFTNCPLEVCEKRDPKGLYKKARVGEIANFTGISDPYEPPGKPELMLNTAKESPDESAKQVIATLRMHGWLK